LKTRAACASRACRLRQKRFTKRSTALSSRYAFRKVPFGELGRLPVESALALGRHRGWLSSLIQARLNRPWRVRARFCVLGIGTSFQLWRKSQLRTRIFPYTIRAFFPLLSSAFIPLSGVFLSHKIGADFD
jgi:hypothetical protein